MLEFGLTYDEIQNSDLEQIAVFQKAFARRKIDADIRQLEMMGLSASSKGEVKAIRESIRNLKSSRRLVSD